MCTRGKWRKSGREKSRSRSKVFKVSAKRWKSLERENINDKL